MPIYEYVCSDCGFKFELLRRLNQADEEVSCPQCQNTAKRVMSTFDCLSKSTGGLSSPIAGSSSCPTCSATGCDTCNL